VARPVALIAGLSLLGGMIGCGGTDPRFKQLTVGISRDSALKVIGVEKPSRADPFLVNGHYIEVLYYTRTGAQEPVPDRKMSPVVVVDGKLVGWGWRSLDSVAGANKLPVAAK